MSHYVLQAIVERYNTYVDKFKFIMLVTWIWAYIGMQISKMFNIMFRCIMLLPDKVFSIPNKIITCPKTKQDTYVHIIQAKTDVCDDITQRFIMYLKFYWQKNIGFANGFLFSTFCKLFNCTSLYCLYVLSKNKYIHKFDDVNCINIVKKENKYFNNDKPLPHGFVSFDEPEEDVDVSNLMD